MAREYDIKVLEFGLGGDAGHPTIAFQAMPEGILGITTTSPSTALNMDAIDDLRTWMDKHLHPGIPSDAGPEMTMDHAVKRLAKKLEPHHDSRAAEKVKTYDESDAMSVEIWAHSGLMKIVVTTLANSAAQALTLDPYTAIILRNALTAFIDGKELPG